LTDVTFNDLPKNVFGNEKQVVCRMNDNLKLIAFAASPSSVIEVAVSPPENHKMVVSGIKFLLLSTGFLEYDATGNISMTKK
jgi:hypothetical protein